MSTIETLLPQRYPFLFVDEILSATSDEILGVKTYDNTFLFYQGYSPGERIVPSVILIESMVQCGGAGVTQMGVLEKASWGLASLENVQIFCAIEFGSTVKMVIRTLTVSNKRLKQTGTAFCGGHTILEATWLCLRLT